MRILGVVLSVVVGMAPPAEAAAEVAKALGLSRREVYQRAMQMRASR